MANEPENSIQQVAKENWGEQYKKPGYQGQDANPIPMMPKHHQNKHRHGISFSAAIELLKAGSKLRRLGWLSKETFLYYVPENSYAAVTKVAQQSFGDSVPYGAYIALRTPQDNVVPWVASQTDLLSDDWEIVH